MKNLLRLSLHEKVSFFYCAYISEQSLDKEVDREAIKRWDKIRASSRKSRERIAYLFCQVQNVSASDVRHLDATYRAKRELVLLSEGTIGGIESNTHSYTTVKPFAQFDTAKRYNEYMQECGAVEVYVALLLQSIYDLEQINLQHTDQDKYQSMTMSLQTNLVLVYLLIVFNRDRQLGTFDRQMYALGVRGPTFALTAIMECLEKFHSVPSFPTKRLLMLFFEWFSLILGDHKTLEKLKRRRRRFNHTTNGAIVVKSFGNYRDTATVDPQDPYLMPKKKLGKVREQIHQQYAYQPHYLLPPCTASLEELATCSMDKLDQERDDRIEAIYQICLPRLHAFGPILANLIGICCGSALNAREKRTFFTRQQSSEFGEVYGDANGDAQYWKWLLREKAILLDISCLLLLLMHKHFRASHAYKAEYLMQFLLEANMLATLTKFMNKDLATYLQVIRQEKDDRNTGFGLLERECMKKSIKFDDDMAEYAIPPTRTITSILRLLQKLTKRKPNIIKNMLCRSASIRVVALSIPLPRLYALKLVKSQAKYLGHQWLRKYTCLNLLTEIYLYVRPELEDDWLRYEDEDLNKAPLQENIERLLFGEVQAYHHKYYWDTGLSKSTHTQQLSLAAETRIQLEKAALLVDGDPITSFYEALRLDTVSFSQQYEKWLDKEGILAEKNDVALPVAFT
ncbi:unnamed protein product [Albugo candida]|uniref:Far11/STRP C-terminal domain-containing protein n=1 Tax=Albugo candida TaxID=65357 RepID=A0A024GDT4_9STRA|nr:unnamed protein product [Albugo candida]|eukprot:CCI44704.1 unnamed protein product [Albugo candida]